jgi:hypothetical protein
MENNRHLWQLLVKPKQAMKNIHKGPNGVEQLRLLVAAEMFAPIGCWVTWLP